MAASDHFPLADDPTPDPTWPLRLYACERCHLVQLGRERGVHPEPQMAVDSRTALAHARRSAAEIVSDENLRAGARVLELDSSHGASWLPAFLDLGLRSAEQDAHADLVVDVHYLMHVDDPDAVIASHVRQLAPGGRLVLEFFHVLPVVEQGLVDTIRHGHFLYLSVLAAEPLLARHGLTVTRALPVDVYGGSVRLTAARTAESPQVDASVDRVRARERTAGLDGIETLLALGAEGRRTAESFHACLTALGRAGRKVAGYGAPSKATVLLALAGVGVELLPYTVDLSPAKHGRRVPGAGVPIRPVEQLLADRPDDVFILTWDIAEEVAGQFAELGVGTGWSPRLWAPLPRLAELPRA